MPPAPRRAVVPLLVVYLAAVGALTLTPGQAHDPSLGAVRAVLRWLDDRGLPLPFAVVEAVANVVMFVPFGVLVSLLPGMRRGWVVVLLALATSATIETVQRVLPDRVPTLQDVVMNTLGAAVGVLCLRLALRRRASPGPGRRLKGHG